MATLLNNYNQNNGTKDSENLTQEEINERIAILKRFRHLLEQQRNKFKNHAWYYITEWGPLVLVAGFGIFTMIHCLRHEPWHDFRPWNIGKFISVLFCDF